MATTQDTEQLIVNALHQLGEMRPVRSGRGQFPAGECSKVFLGSTRVLEHGPHLDYHPTKSDEVLLENETVILECHCLAEDGEFFY